MAYYLPVRHESRIAVRLYEWIIEAHKNLHLTQSQKYFLAARVYLETLLPRVDVPYSYIREAYIYLTLAWTYMQSSINCIHHFGILHTPQYLTPGQPGKTNRSLQNSQIRALLTQSRVPSVYSIHLAVGDGLLQERTEPE